MEEEEMEEEEMEEEEMEEEEEEEEEEMDAHKEVRLSAQAVRGEGWGDTVCFGGKEGGGGGGDGCT